ncbi:MAG TPA: hypothetical protein HA257_01830 [Candidatus Methanoperedenaceae archaeon]|nr:hypothetical protein [Candidatus Methanoperedenaceae archaeon]
MRARELLIFLLALVVVIAGISVPLWLDSAMPLINDLFMFISDTVSGLI